VAAGWRRVVLYAAMAAAVAWAVCSPEGALASAVRVSSTGAAEPLGLTAALQDRELMSAAGTGGVLLLALGFFSMSETAITTLWPWKVRELADKEGDGSPFVLLQNDITRFLTTILIGCTVTSIGATALITDLAMQIWGESAIGAVTAALTVVTLLFCEIMPKSVAVQNAAIVARLVIRPIAACAVILYPVGRICTWISRTFLALFGFSASEEPFVTSEELKLVLSGAQRSGELEREEQDMIEDVLELRQTDVREVMTPLVDVVAIEDTATLEKLREMWSSHQYSRVPVYEGRIDNIIGLAYSSFLVENGDAEQRSSITVGELVRRSERTLYFVPEVMSTWTLLREFRDRKTHMAIVCNEHGGITGIVTMEDAIEEIVGEIYDETDAEQPAEYVVERTEDDGTKVWEVDCRASMDELADVTAMIFPDGSYETASGYVCALFECIPQENQSIVVELLPDTDAEGAEEEEEEAGEAPADGAEAQAEVPVLVTVVSADARAVRSVEMRRLDAATAAAAVDAHVAERVGGRTTPLPAQPPRAIRVHAPAKEQNGVAAVEASPKADA